MGNPIGPDERDLERGPDDTAFPDGLPPLDCDEDPVSCDCSWHENARQADRHNAAMEDADRRASLKIEAAEEKRARKAARGPGFSVPPERVETKRTSSSRGPSGNPFEDLGPAESLALASTLLMRRRKAKAPPESVPGARADFVRAPVGKGGAR